ncbi:MAG: stage II sporulation protein M [Planctomycetes bacterium]|nr:stage II sporulation protein M [Planctomycetota bacterium]
MAESETPDLILIETPENVRFTFRAAGVGVRALAYLIDLVFRMLPVLAIAIILSLTGGLLDILGAASIVQALCVIGVFLMQWGYYVLFETLWNGRTPGKRYIGIRVVMDGGYPVTFTASAVRNLVRILDALPGLYAFGVLSSFISRHGKRLGDFAAGTIVVKEEPFDIRYLSVIENASAPSPATTAAAVRLSPAEVDLVARYLQRQDNFDAYHREDIAKKIVEKIAPRVTRPSRALEYLLEKGNYSKYLEAVLALAEDAAPERGDTGVNRFVKTHKEDWLRLVHLTGRIDKGGLSSLDPAGLRDVTRLYRRLAGDLAYAETFFGATDLTRFLNSLLGRAHNHIYRAPRRSVKGLAEFFRSGFPALFQRNLRYFALSLYIFLGAMLFGVLAFAADSRTAGLVLPQRVIENVHEHEMWTRDVFAVTPASFASAAILTNNITVTFAAFGLGLAVGLGSMYILVLNGMMFGVVLMLTGAHGMSYDLWSFVGAHGFIELFIIILAGAGGLRMGLSLLAPGDLPRLESLKTGATEGVLMVLGGAPVLVVAGLVEGFISPQESIPGWVKIVFGLALLAALVLYLGRPVSQGAGKPGKSE